MHLNGCREIRWFSILLPALSAASIEAGDYDPKLLFDAARAFSQTSADTNEPFLRIAGNRTLSYRTTFPLRGTACPYALSGIARQSMFAEIDGNLEGGYRVKGRMTQSDAPVPEDRAVLSVWRDADRLTLGDLPLPERTRLLELPAPGKGVRIEKKTGVVSFEGAASVPGAALHVERQPGNGSQGPYRLSHIPVVEGSEKVKLLDGVSAVDVPRDAYTMQYSTGCLNFTKDLVERDRVIEVSYLERGGGYIRAARNLLATCNIADSTFASVQVLRTYGNRVNEQETSSSLGLESKLGNTRFDSEIALAHSGFPSATAPSASLGFNTETRRVQIDARFLNISDFLARIHGSTLPSRNLTTSAQIAPVEVLHVFGEYTAEKRQSDRAAATCGVSIDFFSSSNARYEHVIEKDHSGKAVWDRLVLSREGRTGRFSASVSAGGGTRSGAREYGFAFELPKGTTTSALFNCDYSTDRRGSARFASTCELQTESDHIGSASLSIRANAASNESLRRTISASISSPRRRSLQFGGRYDLRCVSQEEDGKLGTRETQEFTGSSRFSLGGFQIDYCPRMSVSCVPEVSEHKVVCAWCVNDALSLGGSTESARQSWSGKTGGSSTTEASALNCRLRPKQNLEGSLECERREESNLDLTRTSRSGWRSNALTAVGQQSSLCLDLSDFHTATTHPDSGSRRVHDKAFGVAGTRELEDWATARFACRFTRREKVGIGHCFSPEIGFTVQPRPRSSIDIALRTSVWIGLAEADEETASIRASAGEKWLTATCALEYRSVSSPPCETITLSLDASAHF